MAPDPPMSPNAMRSRRSSAISRKRAPVINSYTTHLDESGPRRTAVGLGADNGPVTSQLPIEPPAEDALAAFSPLVRDWFSAVFEAPTAAQTGAWGAISEGRHTLVVAPTGSGKTLAAFLSAIDGLVTAPPAADARHRCRVLYVSPLK